MFSDSMTRAKALIYLVVFFILSVLIRIPNLNRPLSKHHEYNTAVILIGIESWEQGGGAAVFNFVPLLNYQQKGDYSPMKGPHIDSKGNHVYLSFGPGWYVIPYLFFKLFNLPPVPLSLQILNLLINAFTIFTLFLLLERLWAHHLSKQKYPAILISCIAFLFSPNILWFLGNGYVCTGIMLPFVLMALFFFVDMFTGSRRINLLNLSILFLLGVVIIYIDWFGVFLYGSMGMLSLFFARLNRRMVWVGFASGLSVIAGISFIMLQFASYIGFDQLFHYWGSRFEERSVLTENNHFARLLRGIPPHFITSYFPILLLLIFLLIIRIKKGGSPLLIIEKVFIALCVMALIPFNAVFLEWTSEHDFSIIPYSILFSFLTGVFILHMNPFFKTAIPVLLLLLLSITQYYIINKPGPVSQNGTPYRTEMDLGNQIKNMSLPRYTLFTNLPTSPLMEYYAKRKLIFMRDKDAARDFVKEYRMDEGLWLEGRDGRIVGTEVIKVE
jgi:hypothetical protein